MHMVYYHTHSLKNLVQESRTDKQNGSDLLSNYLWIILASSHCGVYVSSSWLSHFIGHHVGPVGNKLPLIQ